MLMYSDINLLILDEPTNHLDIDSREELEDFLKEFRGTLLVVSHDRYFINNIASRVIELSQGSLVSYNGNYEYYKEKTMQLKREAVTKKGYDENKIIKAKKEKTSKPVKTHNNEWIKVKLEEKIEKLEESLKVIEDEANKFCGDYEKLNTLYSQKIQIQEGIDRLMEEYFKQ